MELSLTAAVDDDGRRLDRILRKALRELPLSAIHRILRQGCVRVNGQPATAARRIRAGETITVTDISGEGLSRKREGAKSKGIFNFPGYILFEGAGLLLVNKPAGLAVHGEAGGSAPHLTERFAKSLAEPLVEPLAEQVLAYLTPKLPPSLSFRPGPLHRLDKPSSGVIAFSASLEGARHFSAMMRERKIKKFYLAIVEGVIAKAEIWQDELSRDRNLKKTFSGAGHDGKTRTAITRVKPLARNAACTLILAEIETGRSHQIRAQAAAHGHPLLGDKKYGGKPLPKGGGGFLLHAWRMEFPADNPLPDLPGLIEAPLPDYFRAKILELFGELGL